MANSPIYDVFFVGHAYQNDEGETKAKWIEAGTGFPTNDGEGISIKWDTILPEVATVVEVNDKGDKQQRMLPVQVCIKRRTSKADAPTSKKKAPAKLKATPAVAEVAVQAESSNAIPF